MRDSESPDFSVKDAPASAAAGFLLAADDPRPAVVENPAAASDFVLVCDHAGRATPRSLGRLGLPPTAFDLHIAWDLGALALARRLSQELDAVLVHQSYSRLVIDCNRAPGHAGAIVASSDGVDIPGNCGLSLQDRSTRVAEIHAPYHRAIAAAMDRVAAGGRQPQLVCVHSFTPVMQGLTRPWSVGVLHGPRSPASEVLLALLGGDAAFVVGDNEPYAMDGIDFTAPHHAWSRGLDVLEIEVRQDLLASPALVEAMAERLHTPIASAWAKVRTGSSCVLQSGREPEP
ncbi:MAG TPA: N-formylglutamate amidohydrolase [Caulobacteraceae bacterium]|jgi:predicted N-formylglutamate amidohydrolase|nr:N-formylglutamate amidohydrolase [Caulobacteraceae bacterium]